jgi:hypothetical protein
LAVVVDTWTLVNGHDDGSVLTADCDLIMAERTFQKLPKACKTFAKSGPAYISSEDNIGEAVERTATQKPKSTMKANQDTPDYEKYSNLLICLPGLAGVCPDLLVCFTLNSSPGHCHADRRRLQ